MTLLTRASQVSRAVKNVGRMREIAATMGRFGFGELVDRLNLKKLGVDRVQKSNQTILSRPMPVRLRLLLEQLGPTFIKVGQILSGRPDLVPHDIVKEFEKLQDHVAPLPFNLLKESLEKNLGRKIEECFSSFDTEALASASIAQVHAARTLDGDDVVVKIKKPEVEKILNRDLEILEAFAALAEKYIPEVRSFRPTLIVNEFKKALLLETDFTREANHIKRFRENFATSAFLVVPKVYFDLSGPQVLTMERLRGVKLSNLEAVRSMGVDPHDLLSNGMDCFFQSMLVDGLFHGDPHGGNILVLPDGRMGLIDFGSVGWLSQKSKDALINMFLSLVTEDYDSLVAEYLRMSPPVMGSRSSTNLEALQREVGNVFAPYHGLPLKEIPAGKLLMDATYLAFRHKVTLPADLVLVFKAIMTLEGIARTLDPNFDLLASASKYSKIVLKDQYDPKRIGKDLLFMGRDWGRFLQSVPRQMTETLRQIESGELKLNLHVSNLDRQAKAHLQAASRVAQSILAVGVLTAAVYCSGSQILPIWAQLSLWGFAVTLVTISFFKSLGS